MQHLARVTWSIILISWLGLTACQQAAQVQPAPQTTSTIVLATTVQPQITVAPAATVVAVSHLQQALAWSPATTEYLYFTDWSSIKAYKGVPELSSRSPLDARLAFVASTNRDQAAASGYAVEYLRTYADTWGWDTSDVVWEATTNRPAQTPAYVLQLRPDFDFAPVVAHFRARDFNETTYVGTRVYTHTQQFDAPWLRDLPVLGVLNTAILPDEHMLVLSAKLDNVHAILDAHHAATTSLAHDTAFQATSQRLGSVSAAILGRGSAICDVLSFDSVAQELRGRGLSKEQIDRLKQQFATQTAALHSFAALGIGYRNANNQPLGLIVFHYADAAVAQADLGPRREAASTGQSLTTGQPYSVALFTVATAMVTDSDLVLQVRPRNDQPARLFQMVNQRDIGFAACP